MKVVIVRFPGFLAPLMRRILGIRKEKPRR